MTSCITLVDLASELGLDKSSLYKRAKRDGIPLVKVPRQTRGGVHDMVAVPVAWADALRTRYRTSRGAKA